MPSAEACRALSALPSKEGEAGKMTGSGVVALPNAREATSWSGCGLNEAADVLFDVAQRLDRAGLNATDSFLRFCHVLMDDRVFYSRFRRGLAELRYCCVGLEGLILQGFVERIAATIGAATRLVEVELLEFEACHGLYHVGPVDVILAAEVVGAIQFMEALGTAAEHDLWTFPLRSVPLFADGRDLLVECCYDWFLCVLARRTGKRRADR